ncbi:ATPase, F1 complex, OSCP/delta subunit [Beggiatoa sp. PS]|nr:ATPase, F1 complex, OSCP/delta subunit [Beggiatoa sp. PS]
MAEIATLARPYAEAVFKLAVDGNNFEQWSNALNFLSIVIQDPIMGKVIANPKVEKETLTRILFDICDEALDEPGKNLVKILVDYHRLPAMPQIALQYEQLKAQHEGYVKVDIASAYPVKPEQQQEMEGILKKRLGKGVDISINVDKSLLGGWLIHAGDQVIDLSVKGHFEKLATELRR